MDVFDRVNVRFARTYAQAARRYLKAGLEPQVIDDQLAYVIELLDELLQTPKEPTHAEHERNAEPARG